MSTFSKTTAAGLLASFVFCLALSEMSARWAVARNFCYNHWDFTGDLTSLPEARDRIHSTDGLPHRLFFLGDSVLGPSALKEHRVPHSRQASLSAFLSQTAEPLGWTPFSLGADGLLLPDLEALGGEFQTDPPEQVVLILNMRMFAADFEKGQALSRSFLLPDLPLEFQTALSHKGKFPLDERMEAWLCLHWVLFREAKLLRTLWYYPSQKDFFQSSLEKWLGSQDDQDLREAALKLKVAPYYAPHVWNPQSAPFKSLDRLLKGLHHSHIPVLVLFTPQNFPFLDDPFDARDFSKNQRVLASLLKNPQYGPLRYLDWSGRFPPNLFLDHCHLTPEGNLLLASDLVRVLGKAKP
jgi:hypothetical protein